MVNVDAFWTSVVPSNDQRRTTNVHLVHSSPICHRRRQVGRTDDTMIDGLKLTMSGGELRELLEARIGWHRGRALDYARELQRQDEDESVEIRLPEHIVEHMRDEHESRADTLALIRDHLIEGELYLLGQEDLIFAEMISRREEQ